MCSMFKFTLMLISYCLFEASRIYLTLLVPGLVINCFNLPCQLCHTAITCQIYCKMPAANICLSILLYNINLYYCYLPLAILSFLASTFHFFAGRNVLTEFEDDFLMKCLGNFVLELKFKV